MIKRSSDSNSIILYQYFHNILREQLVIGHFLSRAHKGDLIVFNSTQTEYLILTVELPTFRTLTLAYLAYASVTNQNISST